MSTAIYNEIEPFAAAWMRELMANGHIAQGVVDERSISDLTPADVAGPGQRHFFAGIGGWSYALRLAGAPDDADVWTGSCPCQPFSSAGKRGGTSDARHLWPAWFALIEQCRPPIVFGEQVASKDGLVWLDLVFADLERCGYTVGAADLCAAGVGAPHIRQRLYFVAYASNVGLQAGTDGSAPGPTRSGRRWSFAQRSGGLGNADEERHNGHRYTWHRNPEPEDCCDCGHRASQHDYLVEDCNTCSCCYFIDRRLGDSSRNRALQHARELPSDESQHAVGTEDRDHASVATGATRGLWANADWIPCIDGVSRPAEPGTFPLAHGVPERVGRLRGYGNAIVPQVAATFIRAALDAMEAA